MLIKVKHATGDEKEEDIQPLGGSSPMKSGDYISRKMKQLKRKVQCQ